MGLWLCSNTTRLGLSPCERRHNKSSLIGHRALKLVYNTATDCLYLLASSFRIPPACSLGGVSNVHTHSKQA